MALPCDHAGLLLLFPAITQVDLPGLVCSARHPSTRALSAWQVLNQRRPGLIDQLAVEDYVEHDPFPWQGNGRAGPMARAQAILGAFSPLQFRLEHTIAEDDLVVLRWSLTGTHRGEFLGIPPPARR